MADPQKTEQFAALTINLPDNRKVIAFRGTDNTVYGWKEDFNLAWEKGVPSEIESTKYVDFIGEKYKDSSLNLTGHSKGGHLAYYAAISCKGDRRKRIESVINFDGPGLNEYVFAIYQNNFNDIKDKIVTYVPQTSIIGMLLMDPANIVTILSNEIGIRQHNQFSWQIGSNGNFIVLPEGPDHLSRFINKTLDDTMEQLTVREREEFVEAIFLLGAQDSDSFSDMGKVYMEYFKKRDVIGGIEKIIFDFVSLTFEQKKALLKVITGLFFSAIRDEGSYK